MSGAPGEKAYWDSVAGKKEFSIPFDMALFKSRSGPDDAVLDFGCGYGRVLSQLADAGFRDLRGCDFSEKMTALAAKELPGADIRTNHDVEIPWPDSSCDRVLLVAVLTCRPGDDAQRKLAGEILRVLRPGGLLFAADFLLNTDARNLERYEKFKDRHGNYGVFELPGGAVLRHHSEEWIGELFRDFKTEVFRREVFKTMNGHLSNGFWLVAKKD